MRNLSQAYDAYWAAKTPDQERAAYFAILLFGGEDGYAPASYLARKLRCKVARILRRAALWVEGRNG